MPDPKLRAAACCFVLASVSGLQGCRSGAEDMAPAPAPIVERTAAASVSGNALREVYFGDLHVHSSFSLDSYIFANRNDPAAAYRFARGEEMTLPGGGKKRLRVPLDFVAVTDHAETLGDLEVCIRPDDAVHETEACRGVRGGQMAQFYNIVQRLAAPKPRRWAQLCGDDGARCVAAGRDVWQRIRAAADRFYEPGRFTTLLGFEFSPVVPGPAVAQGFGMLHRNVIFRTASVPAEVFSSFDGTGEDLMKWLETVCREPCRALTIPHNTNYSWGRFFWEKNSDGSAWTQEILERRARIEPLVEIFQIKGASECRDGAGLADEDCAFENLMKACGPGEEFGCEGPDSLVRNALVKGLALERSRGVNPFRYGFIGSTDNHNGASGDADERSYQGHLGVTDAKPDVRLAPMPGIAAEDFSMLRFNPGGLAGVWATKNTREAIWDALARRETFATSGPRIRVRFFGGFDLPDELHRRADVVRIGYSRGVPMGGKLIGTASGGAIRLVIRATRDPDSAPLQKIQIVKGWVENGRLMQSVRDVACSDGIQPDPRSGRCQDNGAVVDLQTCRISADKGASELAATWTDRAFDPAQASVYYARVLENPVCRWSTYDARALGVPLPKGTPPVVKERAWSSPIWYQPAVPQR